MEGVVNKPDQPAIGEKFQEETKYTPQTIGGHFLDWKAMPERYKNYPESTKRIELPKPQVDRAANLWETISRRRSLRDYSVDSALPVDTLATLLWAIQGITAVSGDHHLRTTPSAGALYPIETYLMARAVEGLETGLYHFRPYAFDLELIKPGDHARALAEAALGQSMVADAQTTFIWTAMVARSKWKYRQRAYRYIYLDAGHIAQNLYLAGTAAGLGVCGIAAFFDDQVNSLIEVDGFEETAVYLASVGVPE
jgi:SagB-type dehydrogenase family enzyme